MIRVTVPGSTAQEQQQMYDQVKDELEQRDGFVFHAGHESDAGWEIHEVWETRQQLQSWLDEVIFPRLPDDAPKPQMEFIELGLVVTA